MSEARTGVLEGITIARALSCLLIASFHISEHLNANAHPVAFPFSQTPGIHVFMVMSGFMCALMVRRDDNFFRFAARRLARLLPLYWTLTTVAILLGLWRPWLLHEADLSWDSILSSYLLAPHLDQAGQVEPILFVGWMVQYIVLLNLLLALSLHGPARLRPLVVLGGVVAIMVTGALLPAGAWHTFLMNPIQLEFAAGVAVAAAATDTHVAAWIGGHRIWPLTWLGVVSVVGVSLTDVSGALRVLLCGSAAAVTIFGLATQDMYRTPLKGGPLTWLGTISYSIYLLHPLVIPFVGLAILGRLGAVTLESGLMFAATLAVTVAGAYVCSVCIERPSNEWMRRKFGIAPRPAASAARVGQG